MTPSASRHDQRLPSASGQCLLRLQSAGPGRAHHGRRALAQRAKGEHWPGVHRLHATCTAAQAGWTARQARWGAQRPATAANLHRRLPPLPLARRKRVAAAALLAGCYIRGRNGLDTLRLHPLRTAVGLFRQDCALLTRPLAPRTCAPPLQLLPNLTVSLVKTYQGCSSGESLVKAAASLALLAVLPMLMHALVHVCLCFTLRCLLLAPCRCPWLPGTHTWLLAL